MISLVSRLFALKVGGPRATELLMGIKPRFDDAIRAFGEAVALDPDYGRIRLQL